MKNKIAIIESGFMSNYIEEFMQLCKKHNIEVHLFTFYINSNYETLADRVFKLESVYRPKKFETKTIVEEEIKSLVNTDDYDYFLTDCMGLSFTCNIFHNISLTQRMSIARNPIYRKILQIFHKKQIDHEKHYYKNCPKMVVVSNYLKEDYSNNCSYPKEKIIVAYPGTNNDNLINLPENTSKNTFTIGAVTCGFVTKGGYNVLGALRVLKKKYSYTQLRARIINPTYAKQKLLKLFVKLTGLNRYVDFLPYQKDINKFYKTVDCVICASNYEAFGRVVTEAMLCNRPVIVGSNVGAADIIQDGGNGFIFDNQNPAKNLAEKIETVMQNKGHLQNLTKEAYRTAKQLSWQNFAQSIFYSLYVF